MIWLLPWEERNDVRHFHWALYLVLLINVAVFIAAMVGDTPDVRAWYAKYALTAGDAHWYQYVTANFLHADLMHLVFNMLFLYLFGDNIEDVLGPLGFLLLYFLGGLAGDLVFVTSNPGLMVPSIGASGCVATIAGAYAVLFAKHPASVRVMLLVFPIAKIELHAFWLLLLWFGVDVAQTLYARGELDANNQVNFVAHGVGFALGFLVALWARFYGVMRRYETMASGHALFGYWPQAIEDAFKREKLRQAQRERAQAPKPAESDRSWRTHR